MTPGAGWAEPTPPSAPTVEAEALQARVRQLEQELATVATRLREIDNK